MLHCLVCYIVEHVTVGCVTLLNVLCCWVCYTVGCVTLLDVLHCWVCCAVGCVSLLDVAQCTSGADPVVLPLFDTAHS